MLHSDTRNEERRTWCLTGWWDCHPGESQLVKPWFDVTGASAGTDASGFQFLFHPQIQHLHLWTSPHATWCWWMSRCPHPLLSQCSAQHSMGMQRAVSKKLMLMLQMRTSLSPAYSWSFKVIFGYFIGFLFLSWIKRLMGSRCASVCVCMFVCSSLWNEWISFNQIWQRSENHNNQSSYSFCVKEADR